MKYWFKLGFGLLLFLPFLALAYFCNGPEFTFKAKSEDRWSHIVIHHSGASNNTLHSIDEDHRNNRNWEGIGYHFLIGNGVKTMDGFIEETFRYRQLKDGAHALTPDLFYNRHALGICLVGDFDKTPPTPKQMVSLKKLIKKLVKEYDIPYKNILLHREVKATNCPGKMFPIDELRMNFEETTEEGRNN